MRRKALDANGLVIFVGLSEVSPDGDCSWASAGGVRRIGRVCRHDIPLCEQREGETVTIRIGLGHDTHRMAEGGPLQLGGLSIPHDAHLVGHSDADVLLHAVTDALLGAASLGDIGEMFPNTKAENEGRDSAEMLKLAYDAVRQAGYHLVNLDTIIFAQRPKLGPHKAAIRRRIAEILDVAPDQVGVKAKTGEQVGPIGREEAVSAECVALLVRHTDRES